MAVKRRMGPETAETRTRLMDAAEHVMRERGYAGVSARSVAKRAGLKYQIVFYYFETMDDLLLAVYRRTADAMMAKIEESLGAEHPLHAFWDMWSSPVDGALWLEFLALANHNRMIRAEKIAFGGRVRSLMAERLGGAMARSGASAEIFDPFAVSMAISCVGGILAFENAAGIEVGHAETRRLAAWCLDRLEPSAKQAPAPRRPRRA